MAQLQIRKNLQLGIAWSWVKFSFATFREKSINFLVFALIFLIFSLVPFIGSLISVFIVVHIYLSADKVNRQIPFGLGINLIEIVKHRNILNYAICNSCFDLIIISIFQGILNLLHITTSLTAAVSDSRVLIALIGLSIFRILFFGISLAILTFNPQVKLFDSLILNWKLLLRHWQVVLLAGLLLLPFLLIPLYIAGLIAISVNSNLLFLLSAFVLLILLLLFIVVTTIFGYKIYADGIIHE